METLSEFYFAARSAFPALAEKTDRAFVKYWGEPPSEAGAYSWFGSVSTALNNEMQKGSFLSESETFFSFVCQAFQQGNPEVKNCIDVSLVENLFWQVSPQKAAPYWHVLPAELQQLYIGFHGNSPL